MSAPNDPLQNSRHDQFLVPYVRIKRPPTSSDIKDPKTAKYYTRPTLWQVDRNPTSGTEGDLYFLSHITANVADWKLVSTGSSPGGTVTTLTGDAGGAVSPSSGDIDLLGDATQAYLTVTGTPASSKLEIKLVEPAADGELLIGHTANGEPSVATLTATANETSVANGAGSITLGIADNPVLPGTEGYVWPTGTTAQRPGSPTNGEARYNTTTAKFEGYENGSWSDFITVATSSGSLVSSWVEVTGTSQAVSVGTGYILNNASLVTATLPSTAAVGDVMRFVIKNTGLGKIAQNAGQTIHYGASSTTTGAGGSLTATANRDALEILCTTANTDFTVLSSLGSWTVV